MFKPSVVLRIIALTGPIKLNDQYSINGTLNFDNGVQITVTEVTVFVTDGGDINGNLKFEADNFDQLNAIEGHLNCDLVGTISDTKETIELRELSWTEIKDSYKPNEEKCSIEANFDAKTVLINPSVCKEEIKEKITIEFGILGLYRLSPYGIVHFNGIDTKIGNITLFYYLTAHDLLKKMDDQHIPFITAGALLDISPDEATTLQVVIDQAIETIQNVLTLTRLMQGSRHQLSIIKVRSDTRSTIFIQRFRNVRDNTINFDIICDKFPEFFLTLDNLSTSLQVESGLNEAIDWYIESINGKTFEYQFINAAICLELLIDRYVKKYDKGFVLDEERFKKIRTSIHCNIAKILKEHDIEKDERKSIYEKFGELNRRTFKEKILSAIEHYDIKYEIGGNKADILVDNLIEVRNIITHQGIYVNSLSMYHKKQEVHNILHLVIRIMLSIIKYNNSYCLPGPDPEKIEYMVWKNPSTETSPSDQT